MKKWDITGKRYFIVKMRNASNFIGNPWFTRKLEDIVTFINGKAHEMFISEFGDFIVVNSKFISSEGEIAKFSNLKLCPAIKNDILMVMSDVPHGKAIAKCYIVEEDNKYTVNQRICILRTNNDNPKFLYYSLNRNKYFLSFDDGVKQTNLRKEDVLNCELNIPESTGEQTAIADALSDTDTLIENLENFIKKKRFIKQGVVQELLSGRIRLNGFNSEWKGIKLGEIGKTYGGLSGKSKLDFEEGISPYIPFLNILNNPIINCSYFDYVNIRPDEKQHKAHKGDLFFNGSSETPEEVGMCSVLMDDIPELYLNSFCFGFRLFNQEEINGLFLSYYFRSYQGRKLIFSLAQGATRYNLSKTNFLQLKLKLPEVDEQTAIANIIYDMDKEIAALEQKLLKYQMIKQGMMQSLLNGKIRLI